MGYCGLITPEFLAVCLLYPLPPPQTVAPLGNAARTGMVKKGDVVVMCSATFGDQLWSCRGCGLPRVLNAVKVRAGPTVTLVLERPEEQGKRANNNARAMQAREEAR